jgi:hypothetical protein
MRTLDLTVASLLCLAGCGGLASTSADGGGADTGSFHTFSCTYHPQLGSGTLCNFYRSNEPNFPTAQLKGQCPTNGTSTEGPCPSAGLVGCCVQTGTLDGGSVKSVGNCDYVPAKTSFCQAPGMWTTTAP